MIDVFRKAFFAGMGALSLTKEKAEKLVEDLVEKGEVGAEEAKTFAKELFEKGQQERLAITETVRNEVERLKENMGMVSKKDLAKLEERLAAIEAKISPSGSNTGQTAAEQTNPSAQAQGDAKQDLGQDQVKPANVDTEDF